MLLVTWQKINTFCSIMNNGHSSLFFNVYYFQHLCVESNLSKWGFFVINMVLSNIFLASMANRISQWSYEYMLHQNRVI